MESNKPKPTAPRKVAAGIPDGGLSARIRSARAAARRFRDSELPTRPSRRRVPTASSGLRRRLDVTAGGVAVSRKNCLRCAPLCGVSISRFRALLVSAGDSGCRLSTQHLQTSDALGASRRTARPRMSSAYVVEMHIPRWARLDEGRQTCCATRGMCSSQPRSEVSATASTAKPTHRARWTSQTRWARRFRRRSGRAPAGRRTLASPPDLRRRRSSTGPPGRERAVVRPGIAATWTQSSAK